MIDIWPRDRASRCWADMTRTFVAGGAEARAELAGVLGADPRALDAVRRDPPRRERPRGVRRGLRVYEAAGKPTRAPAPGAALDDGFFHGLGHGVGLDVHERPGLGAPATTLIAGDVITVEPGCYRPGFGGVRLEDLVLVTEDGHEVLTDFPYELSP